VSGDKESGKLLWQNRIFPTFATIVCREYREKGTTRILFWKEVPIFSRQGFASEIRQAANHCGNASVQN